MQSIIDKLTNNLVVAAFVPSVVFCTAGILIFQPQMSSAVIRSIIDVYQGLGLFFLFVAFTISLFLVYSRELIYEMYKGSYFPKSFSWFEKRNAHKSMQKIRMLRQQIQELEQQNPYPQQIVSSLKNDLYDLIVVYQSNFPSDGRIVPTRLGNILRSAEDCIAARHNLDPIPLWPNLVQVLPASAYQQIENAFNQMSLLVNFSLLAFCFFIACDVSAITTYANQAIWQEKYIIAAIISFGLFYVFYVASLPIAKYYSKMYCSAFHLYRFEVLKQMQLALPNDSDDEEIIWKKVSELLAVGKEFGELYFEYNHTKSPDDRGK